MDHKDNYLVLLRCIMHSSVKILLFKLFKKNINTLNCNTSPPPIFSILCYKIQKRGQQKSTLKWNTWFARKKAKYFWARDSDSLSNLRRTPAGDVIPNSNTSWNKTSSNQLESSVWSESPYCIYLIKTWWKLWMSSSRKIRLFQESCKDSIFYENVKGIIRVCWLTTLFLCYLIHCLQNVSLKLCHFDGIMLRKDQKTRKKVVVIHWTQHHKYGGSASWLENFWNKGHGLTKSPLLN